MIAIFSKNYKFLIKIIHKIIIFYDLSNLASFPMHKIWIEIEIEKSKSTEEWN